MEFIGKILHKSAIESIGSQGLSKQYIVLEESNDKQYKDSIMIEFFGEKCGLIADIKTHDIVKVLFNPRAKEYNSRWYNSMGGWKIEVLQKANNALTGAPKSNANTNQVPYDENEDLPF